MDFLVFSCVRAYTETDSDCPVCHARNAGITDAVLAQQESRTKHNEFHSLLDRSPEPFSLVAEYFGRGLFNRIVIFDENNLKKSPDRARTAAGEDLVVKKPASVAAPAPLKTTAANKGGLHFGTGAEAKMRVAENRSNVIPAPTSEARMRLQEQQRTAKATAYSSSLEANIDWSVARSRGSSQQAKRETPVTGKSQAVQYPKSANPFGEESEAKVVPVAGSNPFGDDDEGEEVASQVPVTAKNPFDEDEDVSNNNNVDSVSYDKSLNPFDD